MSGAAAGSERFADLRPRIVSGVLMAAVAIGALAAGGLWSATLAAVAAAAMIWEWRAITGAASGRGQSGVYAAAVAATVFVAHFAGVAAGVAWLTAVAAATCAMDVRSGRGPLWGPLGVATIGLAAACYAALRDIEAHGLNTALWIAIVTVSADVGGYFGGRLVGGPKLWPRVSPAKTWAGLGGGVALAAVAGWLFSWATTGTYAEEVATVSALAALVAQGGDLAESAFKRRFGVKDAGTLIPGHGGALDRLDGFAAATLVAAAVTYARGQAVYVW